MYAYISANDIANILTNSAKKEVNDNKKNAKLSVTKKSEIISLTFLLLAKIYRANEPRKRSAKSKAIFSQRRIKF